MFAGKSAVISSVTPRSIAENVTQPQAHYRASLSQDIGPWSNIQPEACSATVVRMRWILMIQMQERSLSMAEL